MNKIKILLGALAFLTIMFVSTASAGVVCIDFEDNATVGVAPGDPVEGIYWRDMLCINATNTVYLVAENNSAIIAYQANINDSNVNKYDNGYLTGNGIGIDFYNRSNRSSPEEIFKFTFKGNTLVNNFSLELFDFGDFDGGFNLGYVNATLIAYNASGVMINSASINITDISLMYDALYGPQTLVVNGPGIAYVELVTNPTERFAIDNICFDAYDPTLSTYCLFAGQDIPIGTVDVWHDCENLYVKYMINDKEYLDWYFTETHFDIATDVSDISQSRSSNPIPGRFEYGNDSLDYLKEYSETIPLDKLDGYCDRLIIAAHASVVKLSGEVEIDEESAWGADCEDPSKFNEKNWATYFEYIPYCISCE
ncbi:hypothetical protein Mzhil_1609 [Methanosalsum zhilinae DSM 4017]|uniref:Uncharacterized protein n=1 Tax=Methanosalsum zhilinae (strain DSM 4017 / NBRC 107636 / OCM 62 / WeN5) TaxID=679901 RepID=F7XPL4_METZD|nr:hypothetical protein [Methanosalsum zhilinae]AEH61446.1 hypothetical protein Mzhil_1609 [Methanosalsum zhilinae DSM 4017]